ncbi:helix-turn-helix transcriptional regulator [Albimonas sp. CAU 1670]|uniref:helix-turn-helix domain-containing protein n=1 Tax=Albimonas sp. CAU 1670 TaxID=3032599 RepID=UPI0023DB38CD|nr:helix-turn-helix transcriptional regulator [Albimonas sp. CAU 1670]MDF2235394.1 helix-turn-helix transcriptional regulator [Albimonas sp. CAU 1670]
MKLRVRDIRRAAGITQEELAAAAGITQSMVSHIERGRDRPGLETLELMAKALNVSVSDLFERPEDARLPFEILDVARTLSEEDQAALLQLAKRLAGQ